jgi:hypothetical protein
MKAGKSQAPLREFEKSLNDMLHKATV